MLISAIGASVSCMTTYDAYGRPVQSVDPGVATAGVLAAGLAGYAMADNNNNHHKHHYREGYYYRNGHYYRNDHYYHNGHHRPYYR
ncbi:MAG: hypothetical protein WCS43_06980 [Verrucomicrobiota bacterium]